RSQGWNARPKSYRDSRIDKDGRPGYQGCFVRGEKDRGSRDVLGTADHSERDARQESVPGSRVRDVLAVRVCLDQSVVAREVPLSVLLLPAEAAIDTPANQVLLPQEKPDGRQRHREDPDRHHDKLPPEAQSGVPLTRLRRARGELRADLKSPRGHGA